MDDLYSFVYRAVLTEEALDKLGAAGGDTSALKRRRSCRRPSATIY